VHAYVGTSGFAYEFWKGDLYPEKIDKDAMLECYARSFRAVEINATYYRIPRAAVVQRWAEAVPEHFRFVIKASRRITHFARLENCMDTVEYLVQQLEPLGDKLGPMLFLLPPGLHRDVPRLQTFVTGLPSVIRPVFEFRHASWFHDEVYDVLRTANAAMCLGEYDDARRIPDGRTPLVATADFGYLRLRDESYDAASLVDWGAQALALWDEIFAFFAHEAPAPTHVRLFNDVLGVE
jgi:uncharacterized protein YecE (DUF72 family)